MHAITIGLDIAKSVFQVHVRDAPARLSSRRSCAVCRWWSHFRQAAAAALIGIEACGTAHHWGGRCGALGHEVRLIPPAYVKPFVRRNKNDARDAAAICAALGRPDMRFVAIKSVEQQASRGLERSRELLVKQRTQLMNSVRSQLAEFGIIARAGPPRLCRAGRAGRSRRGGSIPALAAGGAAAADRQQIEALAAQRSPCLRTRIMAVARDQSGDAPAHARSRGSAALTAHAVVTAIGDGRQFRSARDFAAWCGLTPRRARHAPASSAAKASAVKATTVCASCSPRRQQPDALCPHASDRATAWQRGILARRPVKVAVLAQAAKNARIAWALLVSGETFRRATPAAA